MTEPARFDTRPRAPKETDAGGFVVQPRWRLIFQDQRVDEHVTPARDGRAGNVQHLAVSLKIQAVKLSRRVMYPLRRAG